MESGKGPLVRGLHASCQLLVLYSFSTSHTLNNTIADPREHDIDGGEGEEESRNCEKMSLHFKDLNVLSNNIYWSDMNANFARGTCQSDSLKLKATEDGGYSKDFFFRFQET